MHGLAGSGRSRTTSAIDGNFPLTTVHPPSLFMDCMKVSLLLRRMLLVHDAQKKATKVPRLREVSTLAPNIKPDGIGQRVLSNINKDILERQSVSLNAMPVVIYRMQISGFSVLQKQNQPLLSRQVVPYQTDLALHLA